MALKPLTERVSDISKRLDFWWSIPQKGAIIGHFGAKMIQPSSSIHNNKGTVATKEVVLRGAPPPSVDGVKSDKKVDQILNYLNIVFISFPEVGHL